METLGSTELYRALLDQSPDGIVVVSADGRFAHVNARACELLGYEPEELRGMAAADVADTEDHARSPLRHADVEEHGSAIGEQILVRKDGGRVTVEAHARSLPGGGRQIVWRDITGRLQAEADVRVTQGVAKAVLERVSDAFVALDREWRYTWVNERAGELLGRAPADLIGKHIWTEFPEGVGQPFHQAYERALAEQVPVEIEEYYEPWDRWFENRIFPSPDGLTVYFHEITDRKRAERALSESEARFRALFEQSHVPMCTVDLDGRHLSVNAAYCELVGRRQEELAGASWEVVSHPDDAARIREADGRLLRALARGSCDLSYRTQRRFSRPDGTVRHADASTTLLTGPGGEPLAVVDVLVDVTEQHAAYERLAVLSDVGAAILGAKTVEQTAQAALGRLRLLVGAFGGSVTTVDEAGALVVAVDSDRPLPVWPGMRVPGGAPIEELVKGEAHVVPDLAAVSGEGPPAYALARAAGARALAIVPLIAQGELIGTLALVADDPSRFDEEALRIVLEAGRSIAVALHEARLNEELQRSTGELSERVEERTALLRAVLDTTPDAIRAFDLEGRTLFTNEPCSRIWSDVLGLEPDAPLDRALARMAGLTPYPERYLVSTRPLLDDPEHEAYDEVELAASSRVFSCFSTPIREGEAPTGRLFVLRDITTERQAEHVKRELLATVSHEIRTPLTGITTIAELLATQELPEERRRRYYELLRMETERLGAVVNDFLDLQHLERGHFVVERERFDLVGLVEERLELVTGGSSGHEFILRSAAPVDVSADRAKIGQVLANLVSNASKYSPAGSEVVVSVEPAGGGAVRVSVADHGLGIDPAEHGLVFSRFFRGRETRERNIRGTGLGLALSRDIVEAHGGTVGFESEPGAGSTFWFELPLAEATA